MRRWPLLAVLCLLVPAPALAAEADDADPRFQRGTWALSLRLDPLSGLDPAIGYHLADYVSVIGHVGISKLTIENPGAPDDEVRESEWGFDVIFELPLHGPVVPYLGAGASLISQVIKDTGTTVGDVDGTELHVVAGAHFLVGAIASIDLYVQAGQISLDSNLSSASSDRTNRTAGVQYSLYFH